MKAVEGVSVVSVLKGVDICVEMEVRLGGRVRCEKVRQVNQ